MLKVEQHQIWEAVENDYRHYQTLTGCPQAASILTLASMLLTIEVKRVEKLRDSDA